MVKIERCPNCGTKMNLNWKQRKCSSCGNSMNFKQKISIPYQEKPIYKKKKK